MAEASHILEGNEYNFDTLVLENSRKGLVLVDFWAPWVGPSLRQQKVLMRLANDYQGRFLLVTVNTDEQKGIASRFGVRSLPSFKLFRHGKVIEEFHGMQPEADYAAIIDRHLAGLGDKVQLAAAQLWNQGEHDKAIQLLAEGAMAEPENLELPAMLVKLLMRLDRLEQAHEVLLSLPEAARDTPELAILRAHLDFITTANAVDDEAAVMAGLEQLPPDLDACFAAAALRLVKDDFDGALQALIVILRHQRDYRQGAAQRGLLAIFDTLGGDHELVRKYRGELARLIN